MYRVLLYLTLVPSACVASLPNLMPMPAKVELHAGRLRIDSSFRIVSSGTKDSRMEAAIARMTARVFRQAGLSAIHLPSARPALTVECGEPLADVPVLGVDESYVLDVAGEGGRIAAKTCTGAVRGMETFAQLISRGPDGYAAPAVHVEDRPRYPWRGLMLDASRHWMPVAVVERTLDGMSAVKLNVFHWHLSDDQGFRVESKRWPRLHELGSDGNFYTQSEIREVVAYARDRGIRVIPEFDIPGHATSWLVGYPDLASAPGPYEIQRRWGIFEPVMDPSREETYRFLDAFLDEIAPLFPDRFFHIGGDEVEDTQWKKSTAIQAFAREHGFSDNVQLHAYFNGRIQELLKKHGKSMVGWDEVLAPGLASDTVIQSWRGAQSLAEAVRKGYRGILSAGYYLDYLLPASTHYAVDPGDGEGVLGGEACMWSEYVSAETVESRVWPRMAAIAERFWSPREMNDTGSMYARMEAVSRGLEWTGVRHRASYGPMLDRLTGGEPSDALRVLAEACESLGIEVRRDARKYSSLVDLNRFVDAVRPESELVRHLERADLRATFQLWADNDRRVERLGIGELQSLSESLSTLGKIGLEALDYLESGKPAPGSWVSEKKQLLVQMEKPSAEVRLAAVRTVRSLLGSL